MAQILSSSDDFDVVCPYCGKICTVDNMGGVEIGITADGVDILLENEGVNSDIVCEHCLGAFSVILQCDVITIKNEE